MVILSLMLMISFIHSALDSMMAPISEPWTQRSMKDKSSLSWLSFSKLSRKGDCGSNSFFLFLILLPLSNLQLWRLALRSAETKKERKKVTLLSCVQLFVTPWTVDYQAPPSMGFSGKNTGVGCHFLCLKQFFFFNYGSSQTYKKRDINVASGNVKWYSCFRK